MKKKQYKRDALRGRRICILEKWEREMTEGDSFPMALISVTVVGDELAYQCHCVAPDVDLKAVAKVLREVAKMLKRGS